MIPYYALLALDVANERSRDAEERRLVLHEIGITEADFVNTMPKVIYRLDYPVAGPGSFPQYMVAADVARHIKVVLGGQGGDEVFGGYAR